MTFIDPYKTMKKEYDEMWSVERKKIPFKEKALTLEEIRIAEYNADRWYDTDIENSLLHIK